MNRSKSILRSVIFRLLILYPFSLFVSSYLPMHKQIQNTHTHIRLDPMESDVRMRHEAIRLESGTKYAANIWYHMHDYDLAVSANGYN